MKASEILALGKFSSSDLVVSVSESNRKIDAKIEERIDALWGAKKKKAEEEGRVCYNGTSYRLNSLKTEDGKIHIDFGTIDFKTRTGLLDVPGYLDLPEECYKLGCSTDSSVKTSDGMYLMVELSGKSMNINPTDFIGGLIEKPLEIKTGDDIFDAFFTELEEEGSIVESDIKDIYLRAIYVTPKTDVGFHFEVLLNISSEDLLKRFELENKDPDIESLRIFSHDEYLSHLLSHGSKSKQIIANLVQI
ncbi:MAG: hypothetical protein WC761_03950 [Candidatus Paceibacterota bacterium]|jgi:hypothetical protein